MITITLNGEKHQLENNLSVSALLQELGFEGGKVAVERNLEIVPFSAHEATRISNGDRVEIVRFVGGG